MRRLPPARSLPALVALALLAGCQPHATDKPVPSPKPRLDLQLSADAMVFPPPVGDRDKRGELQVDRNGRGSETLEVWSPDLDEGDRFKVVGDSFTVYLSSATVQGEGADDGAKDASDVLTVNPSVPGRAEWVTDRSIRFTADAGFEQDTVYRARLGAVATASGSQLGGWEAEFTAIPRIEIAGKVLGYVPEAGKPKLLAVRPWEGSPIKSRPVFSVLWDQKVDPSKVKERVSLTVEGKPVPLKFATARKGSFDGDSVERGFVLEARPKRNLKGGDDVVFAVANLEGDDARTYGYEVAYPLAFTSIGCGWGYDREGCKRNGMTLKTDGRDVVVNFNNQLSESSKTLKGKVTVTPKPRNLSTWSSGWDDGRITISGDFEPSKTYAVQVTGVKDRNGYRLTSPVRFKVSTAPRPASVSMADGVLTLDRARSRAFTITSRNAATLELRAWKVGEGADEYREAHSLASGGGLPDGKPDKVITLRPTDRRDQFVKTRVDLGSELGKSGSWILSVAVGKPAHGAKLPKYPSWSDAGKAPVALVTPGDVKAMAVHARSMPGGTLVQVSHLATGRPVPGATISVDGVAHGQKTDAQGTVLVPLSLADRTGKVIEAVKDREKTRLQLGSGTRAGDLAPDLSSGTWSETRMLESSQDRDPGSRGPTLSASPGCNLLSCGLTQQDWLKICNAPPRGAAASPPACCTTSSTKSFFSVK